MFCFFFFAVTRVYSEEKKLVKYSRIIMKKSPPPKKISSEVLVNMLTFGFSLQVFCHLIELIFVFVRKRAVFSA